ncbi:MAG: right-handed parallel beta-helix repeat-containing protein [Oligoflexales bacterium]|nr:right-handed parallel beta-helix repeat-containing protein [Oligoflexales bacterium]
MALSRLVSLLWVYLFSMVSFADDGSYQDKLLLELMMATPGSVIDIPEGTFEFDTQLSLSVDQVTIRGKGLNKSILSFKGQTQGAEGLMVTANGAILEGFTIQDTKGDAIKVNRADGLIIRGVGAKWTGGPATINGAYGFYPVQSRNILIEGSVVSGASDAGIYVGQSHNVIVRRNHVFENVAGIEIENSEKVDVTDNYAERNTGGILVFNMPDLSILGQQSRIYGNSVVNNNTENFSPPSNVVADVPTGTGIMITANKQVEVFNNLVSGNQTSNVLLVSYALTGRPINDPSYDPFIEAIYIYDNTFLNGGYEPKGGASESTQSLIEALKGVVGIPFPDVIYDGSFNPSHRSDDGSIPDSLKICIRNNFNASFIDLDIDNDLTNPSTDLSPYECSITRLPAVQLPF